MNVTIIKDGKVVNIVSATVETRAATREHWEAQGYLVVNDAHASIGDDWDGSEFTPQPTPPMATSMSVLDFLSRFSSEERTAVRATAKVVPAIDDFLFLLQMAGGVNTTDARTIAGVNALESGGLLAPGRAAEILA